ncbi:MAG: cohesin domain-containing protein, partial [Vicinamibacterales bacterium]
RARGQDPNIAGQNLPAFTSRKVETRLRLRDGESNLIAGLLREDERRTLRGFPGIMRLPILRQLFADNDTNIRQTDIVMLLTPRIVRTHELTAADLSPIYIGTQGNMALGGPPPLIQVGGGADAAGAAPAAQAPATAPGGAPAAAGTPQVPAGSSPVPGTIVEPAAPEAPRSNVEVFNPPAEPAPPAAAPEPAAAPPAPVAPTARVVLAPPAEMRMGTGPYTVPVSVTGASRLSTITLSITYDPAVLRVRSVQEGTLMRQGGVAAAFTQQVDPATGRVDISITRTGDETGVAGSGLLAALLLEPVGPGSSPLNVSGVATQPGGGATGLQFVPSAVVVK